MEIAAIIAVNVVLVILLALFVLTIRRKDKEFISMVADLSGRHAAERSVLLDRIMARDLAEVKMAQAIDRGDGPRAISKAANEKKLADEAQQLAERGIPK